MNKPVALSLVAIATAPVLSETTLDTAPQGPITESQGAFSAPTARAVVTPPLATASGTAIPVAVPSSAKVAALTPFLDELAFLPRETDPRPVGADDALHLDPAEVEETIRELLRYEHSDSGLIINFSLHATREAVAALHAEYGIHFGDHYPDLGNGFMASFFVDDPANLIPALRAMLSSGLVVTAEPNTVAYITDQTVDVLGLPPSPGAPLTSAPSAAPVADDRALALAPLNDTSFWQQWALSNNGTVYTPGKAGADIDALDAWEVTDDATAIIVAVIDTGALTTHADLAANLIPSLGYDCVDEDNLPNDQHGHGTHVAGIVGAVGNNGVGISGVAPKARMMILKAADPQGRFYLNDQLQAFQRCIDGNASVANASFGGPGYSTATYLAIDSMRQHGIILVAAAGNESKNIDLTPSYPAAYDLDNIVSVGASDYADVKAYFSNYGTARVDLFAPGYRILSTLSSGRYGEMSGTSMAAPVVTGAVALMRAYRPDLTYTQIIDTLLATTTTVPALTPYARAGRLNLNAALRTLQSGRADFEPVITADDRFASDSQGRMYFLDMFNAAAVPYALATRAESPWKPLTYGDIDGDDSAELVLHNPTARTFSVWNLASNLSLVSEFKLQQQVVNPASEADSGLPATAGLRLVASVDVNRDGGDDLVWQNTTGQAVIWFMTGSVFVSQSTVTDADGAALANPTTWRLVDARDLVSDDSTVELAWQSPATGEVTLWHVGANARRSALTTYAIRSPYNTLLKLRDVTGDGDADAIIYDAKGKRLFAWQLDGFSYVAEFVFKDLRNARLTQTLKSWNLVDVVKLDPAQNYLSFLWQAPTSKALSEWRIDSQGIRTAIATPLMSPDHATTTLVAAPPQLASVPTFVGQTPQGAVVLTGLQGLQERVYSASFMQAHPASLADFALPLTCKPANFCDFNGDGVLELAAWDTKTGLARFYPLEGSEVGEPEFLWLGSTYKPNTTEYELLTVMDYRQDGTAGLDLVWRSVKSNRILIWFCDGNYGYLGAAFIMTAPKKYPALSVKEWLPVDVRRAETSGQALVLWYNTKTRSYLQWTVDIQTSLILSTSTTYTLPVDLRMFRRF